MFQARQVWQPHPAKRVPGAVEFQCGANAAETVGENLPIEAVSDADAILQVYEPFLDKGCGLLPTDSAIPFCRAYAKTATLDVRSSDCTGFQDAQQKDVGDEDDAVKDSRVAGGHESAAVTDGVVPLGKNNAKDDGNAARGCCKSK